MQSNTGNARGKFTPNIPDNKKCQKLVKNEYVEKFLIF